MVSGIYQSILD